MGARKALEGADKEDAPGTLYRGGEVPAQRRYCGYERVTAHCRFIAPALGAMPFTEQSGDKLNRFDRANGTGSDIVFPRYCLRAMAAKALPMMGKEAALARRIGFTRVTIPVETVDEHKRPLLIEISSRPIIGEDGRTGLGIQRSEMLPAGTDFTIEALIPTSALRQDEYASLLTLAGQFVGLSPARSSGFGDFEVLEVLQG